VESWRLLRTWDGAPGWNMGLDEAFLVLPHDRPTLRFYTWSPPTLSLGYFQRARDVPSLDRAEAAVRRLTGGGAIHHAAELTFSIGAPADHALYRGDVRASYARVHAVIAAALATFDVHADERGARRLRSDRETSGMCFEHSSDVDLVWGERKGVGSAQRRTRGRVLHHGSVKLAPSALDESVAGVHDRAPGVTAAEVGARIAEEFERLLGVALVEGEPTAEEARHARERTAHFTSEAFLRRR